MRRNLDAEPAKELISSQRPHRVLQNTPTCQRCQVVHKLSLKPSGFYQSHSLITLRTWLWATTQSIYLALITLEKQGYSIHRLIKSRDQYGMWQSLTLSSLRKMTSNELVLEGAQNNTLWPNTGETWTSSVSPLEKKETVPARIYQYVYTIPARQNWWSWVVKHNSRLLANTERYTGLQEH